MIGEDGFIDCDAMLATYRDLATATEALADDHTPAGIFRRARRAARANPEKSRAWKARALQLDPVPVHNAIALSGMVPLQFDERWHIAVALPQPSPVCAETDMIEDLVLIDPTTGKAHLMGDVACDHVGPRLQVQRVTVTADAKAWAREIALHRLEWYRLLNARRTTMRAEPTWTGNLPTALLLAPPQKVRWLEIRATVLDVPAEMRTAVQRAVFAQARLPRIEGRA